MSGRPFSRTFHVRWADLDPNRHMRNTAYLDYATEVRFAFLAENGFPPSRFSEENFGPVIFREEILFLKEVVHDDTVTVDYRLAAASPDRRKFRLHHDLYRGNGDKVAQVTTDGAWMDLGTRKLRVPPEDLIAAFDHLVRTEDFSGL